MGRPVRVRTVLDRKFTGTASAASSSWVEFPTNRQKNPSSRSQILANPASRVLDKSRIPSRYFYHRSKYLSCIERHKYRGKCSALFSGVQKPETAIEHQSVQSLIKNAKTSFSI